MASTATLAIRIISDARQAARELNGLSGTTSKLERAQQRATKVAKVAGAGVIALGVAATKQASDVQQAAGAVDSVFGKQAGKVHALAKGAADGLGLARAEYSNLAATVGSQLGNMGVAQDKVVGKTDGLIKKGGDLAAMFGGTTSEAVGALSSLLRGETDPIERYGVSIKEADIKARLAAQGQDKLTGAAAKTARTQAILALLNKQTAKADGQRARESNSAAQQQERALAKIKNAGAQLGAALLPIVSGLASQLSSMAGFVQKNATAFQVTAGVVAGLAAAVYLVNGAIAAYTAITKIAAAANIIFRNAQLALNLAMYANPVGLVIAAIVALVAIIVIAYKKSDTFRRIVDGAMAGAGKAVGKLVGWFRQAWDWLRAKLPAAGRAMKAATVAAFRAVMAPVQAVIRWVRSLYGWIRDKISAGARTAKAAAVAAFNAIRTPIQNVINKVRDLIGWVRDRIGAAANTARSTAVRAFQALTAPIQTAIGWVRDLISWLGRIKVPSLGGIGRAVSGLVPGGRLAGPAVPGGLNGPQARAALATTARTLVAPQTARTGPRAGSLAARTGPGGAPVQIIIQGAYDPVAVAQQIGKILGRHQVRIGAR